MEMELSTFLLYVPVIIILYQIHHNLLPLHVIRIYETTRLPEMADGWWSWCYWYVSWSLLFSQNTDMPSIVNRYTARSQFGAACSTNSTMWEYLSGLQFCWLKFHCLVPLAIAYYSSTSYSSIAYSSNGYSLLACSSTRSVTVLSHYSSTIIAPSDTVLTVQFHWLQFYHYCSTGYSSITTVHWLQFHHYSSLATVPSLQFYWLQFHHYSFNGYSSITTVLLATVLSLQFQWLQCHHYSSTGYNSITTVSMATIPSLQFHWLQFHHYSFNGYSSATFSMATVHPLQFQRQLSPSSSDWQWPCSSNLPTPSSLSPASNQKW